MQERLVLEKVQMPPRLVAVSCSGQAPCAQPLAGHANRAPRSKSRYRSSWVRSASNSLRVTRHGPLNPNAAVNNLQLSHTPTTPCYATITDSHAANETITPSSTRHAGTTLT